VACWAWSASQQSEDAGGETKVDDGDRFVGGAEVDVLVVFARRGAVVVPRGVASTSL
jgi:hypothetical protein